MASLLIKDVSIAFPLYHGESRSLKKTVFAAASGRLGEDRKKRLVVEALRHVSFEVHTGDRIGFIGSNGAGKTTLLRAMAGIYEPAAGAITIDGAAQIAELQHDVAEFAGLNQFLELPVRTYSSGMVVRLGFALATAIRPQILLMDEWILAGDAAFLDKARHRLETMVRGAEILVLSSHSADIILQWCNRVIWMDGGQVRADGTPEEILAAYLPPEQFAQAQAAARIAA
jgi:lipopolysaccharide transport system ATP-binding protein